MDNSLKKDDLQDAAKTKRRTLCWKKLLLSVMLVILWGGMIYGASYYAKQYIDKSIQSVQQTNAMNVRVLEDRLSNLSAEMQEIKHALQDTDQVLSGSESTQQALNNKIDALDKQLRELERSLKILKEAP